MIEGTGVQSLEQAFRDVEAVAESTRKAANGVVGKARAMAKAAQVGNIGALRKAQADLAQELDALQQQVSDALVAWPLTEDQESAYLADGYVEELRSASSEIGLSLYERDGHLIAYPSVVRILPTDRAIRLDRKRVPTIRPTHLAALLLKNQRKSSGFAPARFLETLFLVYQELMREHQADLVAGGRVMPLARIYKLVTALPGSGRDYDKSDFARDVYTLDSQGPHRTRRGHPVSFPASTGTRRRSSDLFSFVGPNGENVEYYGIKFGDPD